MMNDEDKITDPELLAKLNSGTSSQGETQEQDQGMGGERITDPSMLADLNRNNSQEGIQAQQASNEGSVLGSAGDIIGDQISTVGQGIEEGMGAGTADNPQEQKYLDAGFKDEMVKSRYALKKEYAKTQAGLDKLGEYEQMGAQGLAMGANLAGTIGVSLVNPLAGMALGSSIAGAQQYGAIARDAIENDKKINQASAIGYSLADMGASLATGGLANKFGSVKNIAKKIGTSMMEGGVSEGISNELTNSATDREFGTGLAQSAGLGALIGGGIRGMGEGVGSAKHSLKGIDLSKFKPMQKAEKSFADADRAGSPYTEAKKDAIRDEVINQGEYEMTIHDLQSNDTIPIRDVEKGVETAFAHRETEAGQKSSSLGSSVRVAELLKAQDIQTTKAIGDVVDINNNRVGDFMDITSDESAFAKNRITKGAQTLINAGGLSNIEHANNINKAIPNAINEELQAFDQTLLHVNNLLNTENSLPFESRTDMSNYRKNQLEGVRRNMNHFNTLMKKPYAEPQTVKDLSLDITKGLVKLKLFGNKLEGNVEQFNPTKTASVIHTLKGIKASETAKTKKSSGVVGATALGADLLLTSGGATVSHEVFRSVGRFRLAKARSDGYKKVNDLATLGSDVKKGNFDASIKAKKTINDMEAKAKDVMKSEQSPEVKTKADNKAIFARDLDKRQVFLVAESRLSQDEISQSEIIRAIDGLAEGKMSTHDMNAGNIKRKVHSNRVDDDIAVAESVEKSANGVVTEVVNNSGKVVVDSHEHGLEILRKAFPNGDIKKAFADANLIEGEQQLNSSNINRVFAQLRKQAEKDSVKAEAVLNKKLATTDSSLSRAEEQIKKDNKKVSDSKNTLTGKGFVINKADRVMIDSRKNNFNVRKKDSKAVQDALDGKPESLAKRIEGVNERLSHLIGDQKDRVQASRKMTLLSRKTDLEEFSKIAKEKASRAESEKAIKDFEERSTLTKEDIVKLVKETSDKILAENKVGKALDSAIGAIQEKLFKADVDSVDKDTLQVLLDQLGGKNALDGSSAKVKYDILSNAMLMRDSFPNNKELWLSHEDVQALQKSMRSDGVDVDNEQGVAYTGNHYINIRSLVFGSTKIRELLSKAEILKKINSARTL